MDTDPLLDRASAMAALGVGRAGFTTALTRGDLLRVGRGSYALTEGRTLNLVDVESRHPGRPELSLAARSAQRSTSRETAVGFVHAALAWGLPRPRGDAGTVRLVAGAGRPSSWAGVRLRVAALPTQDVMLDVHGGLLTSPARTVVDCARSLPGHDALAIADAALRRGLVSRVDLDSCLAAMPRWPGVAAARLVIDLADGLRESPLESWSAWAFHVVGLPRPRWQVVIDDPELGRSYRVDCLWDGGLVGEADGRTKAVLRAAESRGATADAMAKLLDDERQREGRLRALGHDVVRWGTRDVLDPGPRARLSLLIAGHLDIRHPVGTERPGASDAAARRPAC